MQNRYQNALQQDLLCLTVLLSAEKVPCLFFSSKTKEICRRTKISQIKSECCVTAGFGRPRMQQRHDARIEL